MGSEIVYCSDCQRRLTEKDFENRQAYVIGVRTLCATCAAPVLAALPPSQREASLTRSGSLTAEQKAPPPAHMPRSTTHVASPQGHTHTSRQQETSTRPRWLIPAAMGLGVLCLAGIVLVVGRGSRPPVAPPTPVVPPPSVVEAPKAPDGGTKPAADDAPKGPSSPREASALDLLRQARELGRSSPADVDGVARLCQQAVWEAEGTPSLEAARKALDAAIARQQAALAKEMETVETEVRAAVDKRDFGAAVDLLDAAAKRHNTPLWTAPLDKKKVEVRAASEAAMAASSSTPGTTSTPPAAPIERKSPERREALLKQAPPGCRLACYLDCGPDGVDGTPDGPSLRLVAGKSHTWTGAEADAAGKSATVAFDEREVVFEATGLAPNRAYLVGFAWWDGDQQGRAQSVWASDGAGGKEVRLLDTVRLPGRQQRPAERLLPVPRVVHAGGKLRLAFRNDARVNAAVGEIWLWESEAEDADAAAIAASLGGARAPATVALAAGPPVLKSVLSPEPTRVELLFNKPLDPATASRAACYAVTPGATVASCALEPGGRQVTLLTSPLSPGTLYTVSVSGIKDAQEGAVAPDAKRSFATLRLPVEGLALWLRADPPLDLDGEGAVRQWPDRSGKGNHAAQGNAVCRPLWIEEGLNGRPVVRFDGQDDVLEVPGLKGDMGAFSLFFVLQPASRTNHNQAIRAQGNWGQFAFHTSETGGVYVGTSVPSRIAPENGPGSNTVVLSVWQEFSYVFGSGAAALYKNGRKLASRPIDKPAPWSGFLIGQPDRNTIHGDVAEILLYTVGLTDEGRRAVERYLHEKYYDPEAGVPPLAVLTAEELKLSPELQRRQEEEVKRVLDAFTRELAQGKTDNERAVAVWNLGAAKIRDPRIAAKLIPHLTTEGDMMRGEAAAALAGYPGDKAVATALNNALGSNRARPRVVEKVLASIVSVGHESSVPALEGVLRSGDPKLGAAAARALGHFRTAESVEALLGVYERLTAERMGAARLGGDAKKAVEERVRQFEPALQEALARLAGQKLPGWADYRTWWKTNKTAFVAGQPTTPITPPSYVDPLARIPEAKGYELVYELDLERLGGTIAYDKDNSAAAKPFDRVAYLVELQPEGGAVQYVWASLDAFTDDAKKIGIPTAASGASFQQKVSNLVVFTNSKEVAPGAFAEGGNIEFWPNNYAAPNSAKVPGASDGSFDFGDQPTDPRDGYGCMQVHNYGAKQTVFAINHWREGGRAEMGIGNSPGQNPDWTFTGNAGSYVMKRLRVFVRPRKP
jgi:hypothetical protein